MTITTGALDEDSSRTTTTTNPSTNIITQLPAETVLLVWSFLTPQEQATQCYGVNRQWKAIGQARHEEEWGDWIATTMTTQRERRHRRQEQKKRMMIAANENDEEEEEEENEENQLLSTMDRFVSYQLSSFLRREAVVSSSKLNSIVNLLNDGATVRYPLSNWDDDMDRIDNDIEECFFDHDGLHCANNDWRKIDTELFVVLQHLVASPGLPWRLVARRLPFLLLRFALRGRLRRVVRDAEDDERTKITTTDAKYKLEQGATFQQRWQAWKLFCVMLHQAQNGQDPDNHDDEEEETTTYLDTRMALSEDDEPRRISEHKRLDLTAFGRYVMNREGRMYQACHQFSRTDFYLLRCVMNRLPPLMPGFVPWLFGTNIQLYAIYLSSLPNNLLNDPNKFQTPWGLQQEHLETILRCYWAARPGQFMLRRVVARLSTLDDGPRVAHDVPEKGPETVGATDPTRT